MELLRYLIDLILHLDKHLDAVILSYGTGTYLLLAAIVFCETGLVVMPILPGDSLLFTAGAFAARGSLNVLLLLALLSACAIAGDAANYAVGRFIGPKAFQSKYSWVFKPEYLERTQRFYDKYGGKTIIIARFVPVVRTFAPFLAGVGGMKYSQFGFYNITGGLLWVFSITLAGYFFGGLPIVEKNFGLVVIAIIIISILPAVFEYIKARREAQVR